MHPEEREYVKQLLQAALPLPEAELNLWPRMRARLEQQPRSVEWFDWALAVAACCGLAFFPELLTSLLYHL
jgi:hypothetical protein